jgi:hypothetical protein
MSWHLIDIVWTLPPEAVAAPVEELTMAVTIEKDPGQKLPVYIAPIGHVKMDGLYAYAGLLSNMHRPGHGWVGRGIIFSRWGERRQELVHAEPDGFFESSGHEGDFIGVRRWMDWGEGTYAASLRVRQAARPEDTSWIRFEVSPERGQARKCGELGAVLPAERLDRRITSFVEIIGNDLEAERIPRFSVVFHPPLLNGRAQRLEHVAARYPLKAPFKAKARQRRNGSVRVSIGQLRDPRGVPVIGSFRVQDFVRGPGRKR